MSDPYDVTTDQEGLTIIEGPGFNNVWYKDQGFPFKMVVSVDVKVHSNIVYAMNMAYREGQAQVRKEIRRTLRIDK